MMNLQKRNYIVSKAIRNSAKGQECTLRSPLCTDNAETTVFCHIDDSATGKGKGIKGSDLWGMYCCGECHRHYSHNKLSVPYIDVLQALIKTQQILLDMGILKVEE
jgi:hypothetical protein